MPLVVVARSETYDQCCTFIISSGICKRARAAGTAEKCSKNQQNLIDIAPALGNNPPRFFSWCLMSVPSSLFTVLLFTHDATVQVLVRQIFKDAALTTTQDPSTFQKELLKHRFDAVVMESLSGQEQSDALHDRHLDFSRTLCIKGSKAALKKTLKVIQMMNQLDILQQNKTRDASLESYLEVKMGEFVKGMRNGSAKNLHPILISAVERPLITSALRETGGNQIQAAELLGLNRNTLRKKIVNLHIPLKQTKSRASRSA